MTLLDTITEISISKSGGYGGINENYFSSFSDLEITSAFEEIMKSAKIKDEKVNEEKPDYDILVNYENGDTHLLHLILGDKGENSVLMYVGHESNTYFVSPDATLELRKLLKVEE